jgi:hypothetical protein
VRASARKALKKRSSAEREKDNEARALAASTNHTNSPSVVVITVCVWQVRGMRSVSA